MSLIKTVCCRSLVLQYSCNSNSINAFSLCFLGSALILFKSLCRKLGFFILFFFLCPTSVHPISVKQKVACNFGRLFPSINFIDTVSRQISTLLFAIERVILSQPIFCNIFLCYQKIHPLKYIPLHPIGHFEG